MIRRDFLKLFAVLAASAPLGAGEEGLIYLKPEDLLKESELLKKGLRISAPKSVKSGLSVKVEIFFEERIKEWLNIYLFCPENPFKFALSAKLGEFNGGYLFANIRLAKSQKIIALAKSPDGRVYIAEQYIKVLISGCSKEKS